MARRYLKAGEIIPPGAWFVGYWETLPASGIGAEVLPEDARSYFVEVPDTLPPEVIALMTEIKSHLTSAQQLMQTLEIRLSALETVP